MIDVVVIPLVLQVFVPLALVTWLAFGRHPSRAALLLAALLAAAFLATVAIAGLWLAVPSFVLVLEVGLFALACLRAGVRTRGQATWPARVRGWLGLGARTVLAAAAIVLLASAASGRRAPRAAAIDLAPPLAGTGYTVVNGGSTTLVNAHMMTLEAERFRAYRGQSYAVDLVRTNRLGVRARGVLPRDPAAYAIFGDEVLAPTAGVVIEAVDGCADMPPPEADRTHMAGNHVLIDRGDAWVLLGHLRAGSVRVRTGDRVAVGDVLGEVGNSGNTGEPHLHVHAQRRGTRAEPFRGDPVPVTFAGRYLPRNARL
jgi:hypothetical protein